MAQDNITPEEKLLKIIENPQAERRKAPGVNLGRGAGAKGGAGTGIGAWFKKLRIDKNAIKKIDLKIANKMVLVLCVIFTLFFIFDFIRMGSSSVKRLNKITAEAAAPERKEKKIDLQELNIADTINLSRKHNIFSFLPPTLTAAQVSNMPLGIEQIIKDLKLVGIIWSNNPQAIIENTKEQKTYLLNKGDNMGSLDIKKVLRDRVILGKDNQEWELR